MTPADAARVLHNAGYSTVTDAELYDLSEYLAAYSGQSEATLDGRFTADQLRAIAAWMDDPSAVAAEYAAPR